MLDVHAFLNILAESRPVFHSEADFQHAFAWELHLKFPDGKVRLERPVASRRGLLHVDILAELAGSIHAFELKYKTRSIDVSVGSERFVLQNHGAQPLGRYDFMKDLERLEAFGDSSPGACAWAIMLTNDSAYWCDPRSADDTSAAFSLCDGRMVSGHLDWTARASGGTKRNRERPIEIQGQYRLSWCQYCLVQANYYQRFRYLAVDVTRSAITAGKRGGKTGGCEF